MISEHMRRSDISQAEPWCFFAILDQAAVPPRALEQRGRCDVSFSEVWLDLKSDGWSPFSQVFPIKSGHWGEEIPQFFIHHAQAFAATYSNAEPATGLGGLERTYLNRVANPIVNPPFKYPFIMIWMTWGMVYYWLYHLIPKIPKKVLLRISYASKTTKRHRYKQAPDTTWYNHSSARRRGLWTHSQMTTGGYDGSRYHGYVAWYWQGTGSVFLTHRSVWNPHVLVVA